MSLAWVNHLRYKISGFRDRAFAFEVWDESLGFLHLRDWFGREVAKLAVRTSFFKIWHSNEGLGFQALMFCRFVQVRNPEAHTIPAPQNQKNHKSAGL